MTWMLRCKIAELYSSAWQIELFFKWIKQTLKIRYFLGASRTPYASKVDCHHYGCRCVLHRLHRKPLTSHSPLSVSCASTSCTDGQSITLAIRRRRQYTTAHRCVSAYENLNRTAVGLVPLLSGLSR